ncbi:MAG: hypothetical protein ACREFN_07780 [Acetobacteraceae bacterium]
MRVLRTILILLLIVLRPVLQAVLWPVAALVRFVTFASPLVLFFPVVILLHTSDPEQRLFAWSMIATMVGFTLAATGLTALQRKLRKDRTLWFGRHESAREPFGIYERRNFGAGPVAVIGLRSYP